MQLPDLQTVSNTVFRLSRGVSKPLNEIQKPEEAVFGKEWAEYVQSQKNKVFKIKWDKKRLDIIWAWFNNLKQETVRDYIRDGQVQTTAKSTSWGIIHSAQQLFNNPHQRIRVGQEPKKINQTLHTEFNEQKIWSRTFFLIK